MENNIYSPIPWELICRNIVKNNVIPILGNEMYQCLADGAPSTAEAWYTGRLLEEYAVSDASLNTLTATAEYLVNEQHERIKLIRNFLQDLSTDRLKFPLIEQFLSIDQLQFYVNTTTYGDILKRMLDASRDTEADIQNFTIDESFNGCDISDLKAPFVMNLFGSLENSLSPAILEEEMLECVNLFIERKNNEPLTKILGAIRSKTLLFIGCSQPQWLTRFLFRNLSNERMASWEERGGYIIVVNDQSNERDDLFRFLKKNNAITYQGSTADFVNEFAAQWQHYVSEKPPKPKEIFLSYSHKDIDAARHLCDKLSSIKNVKCWFDENKLSAGDDFNLGITTGINNADLFIPLISKNSVNNESDGFVTVKGEWTQANYRNVSLKVKNGGRQVSFIMPVAIDDVDKGTPVIGKFFTNLSIADVPGGDAGDQFIGLVKQKLNLV